MRLRVLEAPHTGSVALLGAGLCTLLVAGTARSQCVGDCDGSGSVGISELVTGVNILLGRADVSSCEAFDCGHDGMVGISCLVQAVNNSLAGSCPPPGTPCPLAPGQYSITQTTGGSLRVGSISSFPFPPGGTVIQDVKPGNAQCIHDTIVPFPGGFSAPFFCIPGLGFTVKVTQTGCGVGQIASNGGADYTVTEVGDTSDTNGPCNLPHRDCTRGADADLRVEVTVGDGTPDSCSGGTANAILAIPVSTLTWLEHSSGNCCGDCCTDPCDPSRAVADGTYDPDAPNPDLLITKFPQILDFTTDRSTTKWMDLDGDGCSIAGVGPASGFDADPHSTGVCLDLDNNTVTTVASGPVGSTGSPLFDLTYLTFLPNQFSGPQAPLNATCDNPPAINFAGSASQCVDAQ